MEFEYSLTDLNPYGVIAGRTPHQPQRFEFPVEGCLENSCDTPLPAETIQGKERPGQINLFYFKRAPKECPGSRYFMADECLYSTSLVDKICLIS